MQYTVYYNVNVITRDGEKDFDDYQRSFATCDEAIEWAINVNQNVKGTFATVVYKQEQEEVKGFGKFWENVEKCWVVS